MKHKAIAKWNYSVVGLCSGTWSLELDGKDVTHLIPKSLICSNMNTYGKYVSINCYSEEETWYHDGLHCKPWIAENRYWLKQISTSKSAWKAIYFAFREHDWRHSSCGACV